VSDARSSSAGSLGLLALRIGVGVVMAWHGWQKVDGGITNFAGFLEQLALPSPDLLAYVVTALELGGGILLVIGALTRIVGLLIAIQMSLTGFWIKLSKFDSPFISSESTGIELDFVLMAGALALALLGAGSISLDNAIGGRKRAAEPAPAAAAS
jgi:putative oxidoreductase